LEDAVKIEKKRPDLPSEAPEVLSKLVRTCWEDDPSVRPSFTEIMELLITLVKEKCPGKVAIPPTYYVGTRWESEFVTEDVHRTLSTTHDSARRRVSRTNLQYNNTEDNDFDPSPASLKLQGRFFKKLKWYNPDVEIVELLSVPENQIWAGGSDGSVSIWNSLSGELVDRNYDVHRNSPITAMITIGQGTVAPPTSMTQLTRHASNNQVTTHNTGVCVWTCGQLDDKINVWAVRPLEQQTNLLVTSQNMIAMLFVKIDGANKDKSWRQRICQIKDRQLLVHEADKLLHVLELEGNNHGVADPFAYGENCFYLDSPEPARFYFQVPHQDSFQDWLMVLKAWQKPTSLDGNMIRLASIQNTHTVGLTYLVEVSGQVWSGDTRGNICVWDVRERRLLKRLKLFREGDTDVPSTTKVRTMLYANMFVWVAIENYLYCIDPIRYSMVSTVVMPSGINCMIGVKLVTGKKLWVALQDSTIKVFDIEGLKDYRRKYSIASASTPIIEVHDESKRISTRLALMDKHAEESSPSLEHKSNNTNHNNGSSDNDLTPVRKTSRKHREVESKQLRRHQRADFPCIKTMGPIPLMGVQDFVNIQSNWIWSAGDDGVIRIWNASTYEMFAVLEKKHDGPITMMILWGTTVWSASKGGTICIWT
jgi:WD40 repeat protein